MVELRSTILGIVTNTLYVDGQGSLWELTGSLRPSEMREGNSVRCRKRFDLLRCVLESGEVDGGPLRSFGGE